MRVTQQMLHQNSVRNMNQNLSRFEKTNSQVASGKMLERPSDNPNGVSQAMSLKSSLAANGQYEKNINETNLWLDETDQTIGKMTDVMQRVRELAVNGNNGTLAPEDRATIAAEIKELANQLEEFSKAKVNGQDLFAAVADGEKEFTISNGITIKGSVSKEALFGPGDQLIQSVKDWADSISNGQEVKLDEFDAGFNQLLSVQSEIGARANRVEAFENRMLDNNLQLQKMLSSIEDVDYAEAMIRLKSEESVYQASLASSAKIIQPTLMDFLR
ncbi:Flagellar hook-associated protein 3 [Planococcus massiliensis]|uniref:Flagellar hook-associated protein 3 n=1 Tax=Planococcus massiliensis TaxID=1499687 RepID=A0A098EPX5_9BACL|nr:flagellar hook-associated protein FlgL [Planococcus massiliensis]CEG24344.1 Flagellar hook-associated protein 3 [Planococcus massiliensis]